MIKHHENGIKMANICTVEGATSGSQGNGQEDYCFPKRRNRLNEPLEEGLETWAKINYPFTLSPEVAGLSMSGSSAIVMFNALMLKRTNLSGIRRTPVSIAESQRA
jgi:hypothetical protein